MKKKILLIVIALGFVLSCKKDEQIKTSKSNVSLVKETITVQDVKNWYKSNISSSSSNSKNALSKTNDFSIKSLKFNLDSLTSLSTSNGNILITNTDGQIIKDNLKYGFRKLAFFKDSVNNVKVEIFEVIPETSYFLRKKGYINKDFTGDILVYNDKYNLIGGKKLINNKVVDSVDVIVQGKEVPSYLDKKVKINSFNTVCFDQTSSYVNGNGEIVVYGYSVCSTYYVPSINVMSYGDDIAGIVEDPPLTSGSTIVEIINIPTDASPKADPKKFMDCFGNISNTGAVYKAQVLVEEPQPGTGSPIGTNFVGHVAIALTKIGSNGSSITQVVGFYPSDHSSIQSQGEIHNNSEMSYNVSATYNITDASFGNIINYISGPTPMYDLLNFNCTSFVFNACLTGGINLPDPKSYLTIPIVADGQPVQNVTVSADTPAGLGSSLRNQSSSNVNTNGGTAPKSKGPCS